MRSKRGSDRSNRQSLRVSTMTASCWTYARWHRPTILRSQRCWLRRCAKARATCHALPGFERCGCCAQGDALDHDADLQVLDAVAALPGEADEIAVRQLPE